MAGVRLNKGTWTREEHEAFLRGVRLFKRGEWEAMATLIPTRTVVQIRSHSQKYFREIDRGEIFPKEPYPSQYSTAAGQAGAAAGAYLYGVPLKEQQQEDQKHDQPHDRTHDRPQDRPHDQPHDKQQNLEPKQEEVQKQEQDRDHDQEQLRQQQEQQEQQRIQQQGLRHEQQSQQQLQQFQQYLQQNQHQHHQHQHHQHQHHQHQQHNVNQRVANAGAPAVIVQGQMQPPLTYPMRSWGGSGGSSGPGGIIIQPGLPHGGLLVDGRQHQAAAAAAAAAGPVNSTTRCANYMVPPLVDPFSQQGSRFVGSGAGGGNPSSYSFGPRSIRAGAETGHPGTFGGGSLVGRPVRFGGSNGVPAQPAPMSMAIMAVPNHAAPTAGAVGVSANSHFAGAHPQHHLPPGWQSGGVPGGVSPPLHQGWQPVGGGVQYGGGSGMVGGCYRGGGGFQFPGGGDFRHVHVGGGFPHPASCGSHRVVGIQEQQHHRLGPPPMPGAATGAAGGARIGGTTSAEQQQRPHAQVTGGVALVHGRSDVPSTRDGSEETGDEDMDGGGSKRSGKRDRREETHGGGNGDINDKDAKDEDHGDDDNIKGSNRRRQQHQHEQERPQR